MDFIRPIRALLEPIVKARSVVVDTIDPVDAGEEIGHGVLEYHGTLRDGQMVLFGFYQHSAQRTITAEMWVPDDATPGCPDPSIGPVARRRQVWSYRPAIDTQELARIIVAEITTWLDAFDPASEAGPRAPCAED
jgi:hypothetical protein